MSNILYELREMLMHELKNTTDGGSTLTTEKLEIIDKLTHAVKSIDTICAMEESKFSRNNGNSYGNSYNNSYGYNSYENSYMHGPSYGNNMNMSRDMSGGYMPVVHYSRDDGHSDMMHRLDEMLRNAKTEKEREAIRMCMDKLNS